MAEKFDEFSIIEKYFAPLSGAGSFGFKDDAAILNVPKNKALVVTNDAIAEGVHFLGGTDPKLIAQKAIRTNLSDLAAKGAKPFAISLALGVHRSCDEKWIKRFAKGLESDCKQYGLSLCGGDTFSSSGGITVSITAFGHITKKDYASRLGAKAGHQLYVTGTIGDAALGLSLAYENKDKVSAAEKYLIKRYELPQPRVEAANLIAKYASAAMDISDGFIGDLDKLCAASNVAIEIKSSSIPISKQALKMRNVPVTKLLTGGDDYELLIAVAPANVVAFEKAAVRLEFPVSYLGKFKRGEAEAQIMDENGECWVFKHRSYVHLGK